MQKNNSHSAGKRDDLIKAPDTCFLNDWNSEIPHATQRNAEL